MLQQQQLAINLALLTLLVDVNVVAFFMMIKLERFNVWQGARQVLKNKKGTAEDQKCQSYVEIKLSYSILIIFPCFRDGSSTLFFIELVAKASQGHIPLPFLINTKELFQM